MAELVLDASAVLALVNAEPGWEVVGAALGDAVISAVNLSEVVAKLAAKGVPEAEQRLILDSLGLVVLPFGEEDALSAGLLYPAGQGVGLSFGDRACLALARTRSSPALTADRRWLGAIPGIEVQLIRT